MCEKYVLHATKNQCSPGRLHSVFRVWLVESLTFAPKNVSGPGDAEPVKPYLAKG